MMSPENRKLLLLEEIADSVPNKTARDQVQKHANGLLKFEHDNNLSISQQNQKVSPLLRLPAEIRNKIYEYALRGETVAIGMNGTIRVRSETTTRRPDNTHQNDVYPRGWLLALYSVCRQIYIEVAVLPFRMKLFEFCFLTDFNDWLSRLNIAQREAVELVRLHVEEHIWDRRAENEHKRFEKLQELHALKRLFVVEKKDIWVGLPRWYDWFQKDEMAELLRTKAGNKTLEVVIEAGFSFNHSVARRV